MQGYVTVLFGETLVLGVWIWVALDPESRAVHVVLLWGFVCHVIQVDRLAGYWNLSDNSTEPCWMA